MKYRMVGCSAGALAAAFLLAQTVHAQDPAPGLQDSGRGARQQR
ncbi:MAG: hypothetical protein V9H25_14190 [Candidatus Competibacter sp.]|jgi:hypothetical protein